MQPVSPTMMTAAPGLSDKLVQITCTLFINGAQLATVKVDTSVIIAIDNEIEEYPQEWQLLIDL
jgi:hypothetical protein